MKSSNLIKFLSEIIDIAEYIDAEDKDHGA